MNVISKRILSIAAAAIFAVAAASPAFAQDAALGNITGTVTDATGAVIAGVTVLVKNTDTGAVRTLTTTGSGSYAATFLQPGKYEVIVGGGSFSKFDQKNISVTVGSTFTIDAKLTPASVSSDIVVTSDAPVIETDKTDISQTIDSNLVSNLPVNGRRYDNFVLLTTNVVPDGSSGLLSFRGISGLYNTNLIDGANNQQAYFSEARGRATGAPYVISSDSVKEFQASASGYSAEFGQAAGGQINAITRSGTNAIHGDLFYYLRYPTLNALDPLTKFNGRLPGANAFLLQPSVHQQQQFGGSVGFPILKDKLFGFFTYDGFRKAGPILYTSSITPATLNGYNCPAQVSASQCTNAKNFILGLSGPGNRNLKQNIFFPRLDYQLNANNHLSVEFNFEDYSQPNGYTSSATSNNSSVSTNGRADFHERFLIADWEHVFTASLVNVARFQWSRDLEVTGGNAPGPNVSITGLEAYGLPNALPRPAFPDEHRWQMLDTLSKNVGRHTFKTGVDINLIHEKIANLFQGGGLYTYGALTNQCANPLNQGVNPCTGTVDVAVNATYGGIPTFAALTGPAAAFANYVQDIYGVNGGQHYTNFTQVNDPITHIGADDFWNQDYAAFVEDSWKVSSKLTVDFGLRYDLQQVPPPPHPYTNSANGAPSPLGNYYTNTIHINYKMFQPRFGFAWNPYVGTVVRGGYGIFYGLTSNSTFYASRVENGVYQQAYVITPSQTTPTTPLKIPTTTIVYPAGAPNNGGVLFTPPGAPLAAPFPGALTPTVQSNGVAAQKLAFRGQDPNFTNPYTHSIDLNVEQQLPLKFVVSLAYVGTRGMRLPYFIDVNLPGITPLTRTYSVQNVVGGPFTTITVPYYANTLSRPSPNDNGILVGFSGINTWYHSGAFTIRTPVTHGLEILANYTWSRNMDDGQVPGQFGTFDGTDTILDPHNVKGEYARSDLDMRGRFVGSIVYAPTFKLGDKYVRSFTNGWTVAATATEQDGLPLTATISGEPGDAIDGGVTGGEVGNAPSPSPGRAPQFRRNSFASNGIRNVDARVSRDVNIHENIKMQFFVEAFNVANRRQILSYNTPAYQYNGNTTLVPYTATPFGTPFSTSGVLYGPRQMQFTAKLFF
jgi:hypothetical protein